MPSIFLVSDSPEQRDKVRASLASLPGHTVVAEARSIGEAEDLLTTTTATVAVVRQCLPDGAGLDLIERVRARRPRLEFILMLDGTEEADVWQHIIQLGLRNVISPPVDGPSIRQAMLLAEGGGSAVVSARPVERPGLVVTVASARGGVGKTLIAANLASALSRRHERTSLVDFSGHGGDLATVLNDSPRHTIVDLLGASSDIEPELLDMILPVHPCGLRYLATPAESFNPVELTRPVVRNIVRQMRRVSEVVVIDTGEGDAVATQAALLEADTVLLVTSRDMIRLSATRRYLKQLAEWEISPASVKVVVNEAQIGLEISDSQIESILEHPVAAYLPADAEAAAYSINTGKPLVQGESLSALASSLNKLAPLVVQEWAAARAAAAA